MINIFIHPLKSLEFQIIVLSMIGWLSNIIISTKSLPIVIQLSCNIIIVLILVLNYKLYGKSRSSADYMLKCFLLYGFFVFARGIYFAKTYEQWRYLFTVFFPTLILPCISLMSMNFRRLLKFFMYIKKYAIPLGFLVLLAPYTSDRSVLIKQTSFLYFAIPLLIVSKYASKINKSLIFMLLAVSFSVDIQSRSNILSLVFGLLLCFGSWFINVKNESNVPSKTLVLYRKLILYLPIMLLLFAVAGFFNPFELISKLGDDIFLQSISQRSIFVDSRSGIYTDAFNSLYVTKNYIIGNGPTHIYKTHLIDSAFFSSEGRLGGSESGILGLFMFGGLLYPLILLLIVSRSTYLAVYKSNSKLCKQFAVLVLFMWGYSFVEYPLAYTFQSFVFFIMIGLLFNKDFRNLNDLQIKKTFTSIYNS